MQSTALSPVLFVAWLVMQRLHIYHVGKFLANLTNGAHNFFLPICIDVVKQLKACQQICYTMWESKFISKILHVVYVIWRSLRVQ